MNIEFMENLKGATCEKCTLKTHECMGENETFCSFDMAMAYEQGRADERPKAFANGYESGYKQGREDKEKELQGVKDLGALYSEIRADERANVFEEIIGLLKEKAWVEDENTWLLFNSVLVPISMVINEIEQLKEQKNETV